MKTSEIRFASFISKPFKQITIALFQWLLVIGLLYLTWPLARLIGPVEVEHDTFWSLGGMLNSLITLFAIVYFSIGIWALINMAIRHFRHP